MHPQPAYGVFGFSAQLRNTQGFEQQYAHFVRRKSDSQDNSCRGKHGERDKRERKPPDKGNELSAQLFTVAYYAQGTYLDDQKKQ